jgi:hypothetical protein
MNISHTIKIRKANRIGHIIRVNRLLKHVIEGKIRGKGRNNGKTKKTSAVSGMTLRKRQSTEH